MRLLSTGAAQVGRVPAAALGAGLEALCGAEADPTQGKPHLLAYAAALQQRDYLAAVRSLHRFFDYNAGACALPAEPFKIKQIIWLPVRLGASVAALRCLTTHIPVFQPCLRFKAYDMRAPETLRICKAGDRERVVFRLADALGRDLPPLSFLQMLPVAGVVPRDRGIHPRSLKTKTQRRCLAERTLEALDTGFRT